MSMHTSKHHVSIAMLGLALGLGSLALAPRDAAAQSPAAGPDEAACEGKRSGDACSLINGTAGACGPGTCSRLDYSQGSPPKATEEPCTVCVAGAAPSAGPPALGEGGEGTETSSTTETKPEASAPEGDSTEDEPPKTSSRCSVMDRSVASDLGWLSLLVLPFGVWRRKRRTR